MSSRTWMLVLGLVGATGLGVGLPVLALTTAQPSPSRWVTGVVTDVDPTHGRLTVHPDGASALDVVAPSDLQVGTPTGPEPLARLSEGQSVRAELSSAGPAVRIELLQP